MNSDSGRPHRSFRKFISSAFGIALAAIWILCLSQACRFALETWGIYAECGSINAWNDHRYSLLILASEATCGGTGFGALWLLKRTKCTGVLWLPITVSVISGIFLAINSPEEVIILFPSAAPFFVAGSCLGALLVAAAVESGVRFRRRAATLRA